MPRIGSLPELGPTRGAPDGAVEEFSAKGHGLVRGLCTRTEVAAYRDAIRAAAARRNPDPVPLEQRDTYGRAFLQSTNLWRLDEDVRAFVWPPRFARVAAELLGVGGVRLYHDQALFKEPGGGPTPWHQDQIYWPFDSDRTITMWMPLVDIPDQVGSMTFASGSQSLGDLGAYDISDASDEAAAETVAARGLTLFTYGALDAGDATFHRGWTLHRAGPNPTTQMREVMTIIWFADGARAIEPVNRYQAFDLAVWLKGTSAGELAVGPRNPLLWPVP